jgi:hypothetical protein
MTAYIVKPSDERPAAAPGLYRFFATGAENRRHPVVKSVSENGAQALPAALCFAFNQATGQKMSRARRQTSSSTDRMRSCRERRRNGLHIARVAYPDALPLALCDEGFLPAWDTENPEAVTKAIEAALSALCAANGYDVTRSDDDVS